MYAYTFFCFDPTLATKTTVHNKGRSERRRFWRKWTVQVSCTIAQKGSKWKWTVLRESVRSNWVQSPKSGQFWVKIDGPGFKWTVQNEIKWAVQKRKVDGPQKMKLDVGGQKGMKVDGLKMRGGQKGMKVDGPNRLKINLGKGNYQFKVRVPSKLWLESLRN